MVILDIGNKQILKTEVLAKEKIDVNCVHAVEEDIVTKREEASLDGCEC